MSFKRNIIANYLSQIYVSLIGIVMAPMYLHYMGIEAYGLVGFYAAIQIWFGLLDMGLSLTLVRETARFRAKALNVLTYRRLVFALELIFVGVGAFGGLFLYSNSSRLALSWLNIESLNADTVTTCLQMISGIVVMRWMSGFYRSVLTGMEEFIWLSVFSTIIASLRFIGVIPIFIIFDGSLKIFFYFQCVVGIIELMGFYFKSREMLPPLINNEHVSWSPEVLLVSVKQLLGFSITISLAAIAWAMMTQLDKLLLSWRLPLTQYGVFILAAMAASGVPLVVGPLSNALLPRLARLHAQGDREELMLLYEKMTQVVAMLVAPLCYLLSSFSWKIMFVWTGDRLVATQGGALMSLYALGNGLLALAAFPYYLQYANGKLKLHLIGSVIFLIVCVPMLLAMIKYLGAIGAGYAWF
ncbi:MAG: oligosaccharide flippase family protein [Rhodoferax sp.]|nr:oligosaccharide flippase family protein [Rhodoferax sp.]